MDQIQMIRYARRMRVNPTGDIHHKLQDSDEKFTQSQRAITFSEEAYNFDVIWNRAGSSDASVQVQPDTQSLSIQTAQLSVTSTAAQMDNEPPELDASEGQTVYHATSTQTDETALFWARELAAASALRIKCEELERVLEERERQGTVLSHISCVVGL